VGDAPGLVAEHPQKRLGVHGAGPHLDVERLLDETALRRPIFGKFEDEILQRHSSGLSSLTTRADRNSFSRCEAIRRSCTRSISRSAVIDVFPAATRSGFWRHV